MFDGIRRSYALLTLFLMEAIEELGSDRALEMLQSAVEKQAGIIERELRRKIPEDLPPLEKGLEVYRAFMEDAGAEVTVHEKSENSVTFLIRRCPFYEALRRPGRPRTLRPPAEAGAQAGEGERRGVLPRKGLPGRGVTHRTFITF